jgi:hypothetical protein
MSLLSRIEKLEKVYSVIEIKPMKLEINFVKPDIVNGNSIDPDKTLIFIVDRPN